MSPHGLNTAVTTDRRRNAPATSPRRPTPRSGDVVASSRSARADIHAISVVPAEAHTIVARYPEAIAQVRALSRRLRVDGWYTGDHTHYARVAAYRSRDDAQATA